MTLRSIYSSNFQLQVHNQIFSSASQLLRGRKSISWCDHAWLAPLDTLLADNMRITWHTNRQPGLTVECPPWGGAKWCWVKLFGFTPGRAALICCTEHTMTHSRLLEAASHIACFWQADKSVIIMMVLCKLREQLAIERLPFFWFGYLGDPMSLTAHQLQLLQNQQHSWQCGTCRILVSLHQKVVF